MALYELKQEDISDLHALIVSPSLTITANNALRVAQLQAMLANAQPSAALEELKVEHAKLEVELGDAVRSRDAVLDAVGVVFAAPNAMVEACACGHAVELHDQFGCSDDTCICAVQRATIVPIKWHA
jgi:hypothetical protein